MTIPTQQPGSPPDQQQIDPDVDRLRQITEQIKSLEAAADEIRARLRERFGIGEHPGFTIAPTRRFNADPAFIYAALTDRHGAGRAAELLAQITVTKVDGARAKQVLSGDDYAACQAEAGKPAVRLA